MFKRTLLLTLLPAVVHAEELPAPVKAIEKQGITILKPFDAPGGMKGYLENTRIWALLSMLRLTANTPFPVICITKKVKTSVIR